MMTNKILNKSNMGLIDKLKVAGTIGITALAAGCGTIGPDGRTDGERIMDGFTEAFIGGGGVFRANEQIAASEGDYKKAAAWGALGNTAEANYNRQTQIEAAREGRTEVNVNVGGQQQTDDYIVIGDKKIYGKKQPDGTIYYEVPQDSETQRIIQERFRQIKAEANPIQQTPSQNSIVSEKVVRLPGIYGKIHPIFNEVVAFTCNFLSDLNKDGVYEYPNEYNGVKGKFSKDERLSVGLDSSISIPDVNYKLLNKNGETVDRYSLKEDGHNFVTNIFMTYNNRDLNNNRMTLIPGTYTALWYTRNEFLGKLEFEVYDEK